MKRLLEKIALFFVGAWENSLAFFKSVSKKTYTTLAILLIAALLVVDVGYHLVGDISPGVETMTARSGSLSRVLTSDAYLLREEAVMAEGGGRYIYRVADGEKVKVGTHLADEYSPDADPLLLAALSASLEAERILTSADSARPEKLAETLALRIQGLLSEREDYLAAGETGRAQSLDEALAVYCYCREALEGANDIPTLLASVAAEIDSLSARLGAPIRSIYADSVGWFSYTLDGYEGFATVSGLEEMEYGDMLSLFTPRQVSAPASVGKMISDYTFRFVTFLSSADAEGFAVNRKYELTLDGAPLAATLEKITLQSGEDRVALTFSSTSLAASLTLPRIAELCLVKETYTGLKLPTAALVEKDGVYGVYALRGFVVEFREIELLWREGSTLILAEELSSPSGLYRALSENDNVIIKGDDLYDGKILAGLS